MDNLNPDFYDNEVYVEFMSNSVNEGLSRMIVSAFTLPLNPSLEEMSDLKTAVSEAVTNAIIHAYEEDGPVRLHLGRKEREIFIDIIDEGCGIKDIKQAMEPLFTTREDIDRSGMGFAFMEAFTDVLKVESVPGKGTVIHMQKTISNKES
ncbi:MAG: anti-sigma F factor [Lachnospiraceae bacterium]